MSKRFSVIFKKDDDSNKTVLEEGPGSDKKPKKAPKLSKKEEKKEKKGKSSKTEGVSLYIISRCLADVSFCREELDTDFTYYYFFTCYHYTADTA